MYANAVKWVFIIEKRPKSIHLNFVKKSWESGSDSSDKKTSGWMSNGVLLFIVCAVCKMNFSSSENIDCSHTIF